MNTIHNIMTGETKEIPLTSDELIEIESRKPTLEYFTANVRKKRNNLLAATDWTANSDVTMTTEMTAYRQALRDLPAQAGWPTTINWPTAP